jgi:hypothetical protein
MKIPSSLFVLVALTGAISAMAEQENRSKSFDSPDGRFSLQVSAPEDDAAQARLAVVENASGKVVGDLGTDDASILSHIKVVWSADSKRLAYRTAGEKEWSASVWFWNGSAFESVPLPDNLPLPEIKLRKRDEGSGVKNYGGGEEPVRWLKSGDLELSSQQTQMAHESGRTYTASVTITIGFDAQRHASVKSVSKTRTRID